MEKQALPVTLSMIIPVIILLFSQTKMSTPDNNSHKEEKTDPSAVNNQPEMENEEEEREPGNAGLDQIEDGLGKHSIKVTEEQIW